MTKRDDQTSFSGPRFREHRPTVATPAPNSVENTANPEPSDASLKSPLTEGGSEGRPKEIGGPKGLEPTRYGDWERDGRCVDF